MIRRQPRGEPIHVTPQPVASPPVNADIPLGVDPLMISSLPPMASGADVYMRQFYRDPRLPARRYLQLRGL